MSIDLTAKSRGHWKLNDNEADTKVLATLDNDKYELTSQRNTNLLSTSGKIIKAFNMNGSSDYLSSNNASLHFDASEKYSWSGWFKSSDISANQVLFAKESFQEGHVCGYMIRLESSRLKVIRHQIGPSITVAQSSPLLSDTWYHFVVTYDNGNVYIYIDNQADGSGSNSYFQDSTQGSFDIGNFASYGYFEGILDMMAHWNDVLTAEERTFLWNDGDGTEELKSGIARPLVGGSLVGSSLVGKGLA